VSSMIWIMLESGGTCYKGWRESLEGCRSPARRTWKDLEIIMIPVLIIGYGIPLRSDDGIGWHAAQSLLNEWPAEEVRVESAQQLLPEMADWISDAHCVVFIDARSEERRVGKECRSR